MGAVITRQEEWTGPPEAEEEEHRDRAGDALGPAAPLSRAAPAQEDKSPPASLMPGAGVDATCPQIPGRFPFPFEYLW